MPYKHTIPLEDLIKEAFEAGRKYEKDVYWGDRDPIDFDTWLAALKERIRKEVKAPEGLTTTLGNLDIYYG